MCRKLKSTQCLEVHIENAVGQNNKKTPTNDDFLKGK